MEYLIPTVKIFILAVNSLPALTEVSLKFALKITLNLNLTVKKQYNRAPKNAPSNYECYQLSCNC